MRRTLVVMSVLAASAASETAGAAPVTIETNPFELAEGKLAGRGLAAGLYTIGGTSCSLTPDGSGAIDIKSCPPLAGLTVQEDLKQKNVVKATVRLAAVPLVMLKYQSDAQRRTVLFSAPAGITQLAVRNASRGWVKVPIADPGKPIADADARSVVEQGREAWIVAGDLMLRVYLSPGAGGAAAVPAPPGSAGSAAGAAGAAGAPAGAAGTGGAPASPGAAASPGAPAAPPVSVDEWCSAPDGLSDHQLACFEEDHGRLQLKRGPRSHFLPPNKATLVIVRHAAKYAVSISMGGTAGISQPGVANYTLSGLGQQAGGAAAAATSGGDEVLLSTQPFAPRQPGAAPIRVELRTVATPAAAVSDQTLELIVEQGYLGAIRMGFGIVTDDAVDRSYAAHLAPGSSQREIARTSSARADVELVLGFSAFVWDGRHGRRYVSGRSLRSCLAPAPYIGLGVVGDTANGVQGLRSLYFGVEWEPVRSFSVALTGVGRRVTRLQDGFLVGTAVSEGTSFTEQRFEIGVGVVFSVSPEFLRIASGASVRKE